MRVTFHFKPPPDFACTQQALEQLARDFVGKTLYYQAGVNGPIVSATAVPGGPSPQGSRYEEPYIELVANIPDEMYVTLLASIAQKGNYSVAAIEDEPFRKEISDG